MKFKSLYHVHTESEAIPLYHYYKDKNKYEGFFEKSQSGKGFSKTIHIVTDIEYYEKIAPSLVKQVLARFV